MSARRAVILDRDGTLVDYVPDPSGVGRTPAFAPRHLRLLPGALDGMRLLRRAGYALAVATNQPQAAKGQQPLAAIERTNAALDRRLARAGVPLLAIAACLHHPTGGAGGDRSLVRDCACRKPRPGMLLDLAARFSLDVAASVFVGDRATDVRAARAAGMRAGLLVAAGPPPPDGERADFTGADLLEVARLVVAAR